MSPVIKEGMCSLITNLNSDVSSFIRVDLPAPLGPQSTRAGGGSLESPEAEPILDWRPDDRNRCLDHRDWYPDALIRIYFVLNAAGSSGSAAGSKEKQ